MECCTCTK